METAQDVLEELRIPSPLAAQGPASTSFNDAEETAPAHTALVQALGFDVVSLDALQARTGLATPALQAHLLELELEGHVTRLPGGLFQRTSRA